MLKQGIQKHLRNIINNVFELEEKTVNTVNAIDIELLQQEIEIQLLEIGKNKQELKKTNVVNKKKSKKRNKLAKQKKSKLLNEIENKQQAINLKKQLLANLEINKRLITKMQDCFYIKDIYGNNAYYYYENPINQPYDDTRTDLEANIAGATTSNLVIIEVIKPIIRLKTNEQSIVVQKGVVIVSGKGLNKDVKDEKND